jgi:stage V sporulation protein SpoVS
MGMIQSRKIQALNGYFGGGVEFGASGAGALGAGALAGGGGVEVDGVRAGGGALEGAAAAACAARSNTEVGSTVECVPRYAKLKLVKKNRPANTAVNFENKVLVPRAPNTVPDAPEPNPAPASAPLPRCSSTRRMIISARSTCTPNITPRNIRKSL